MIKIEIIDIEKSFGENLILNNISLIIHPNQINVIIGPSGCGKSTLLQIIAGLDKEFRGTVNGIDTKQISYVFQDHCLLEWKSVEKNIMYALSGKVDNKHFLEYSRALGLTEHLSHYPNQLSGGLLQRVNLLRAFLSPGNLLLMDEPFKSLDVKSKEATINLFLQVQKEKKRTVLLVTHSLEEAVQLGNYIHILPKNPAGKLHTFMNPWTYSKEEQSNEGRAKFLNKLNEIIKIDS